VRRCHGGNAQDQSSNCDKPTVHDRILAISEKLPARG
jgi:hypothetical protein